MSEKAKPIFEKRIFWDVDFENLDYDKYSRYVIERVFERGDEKVREVLLNAKFLLETRMYLAIAVIDRPLAEMRCYKLRQSNPTLFPY